jgi:hypothetical protein
MGMVGGGQGAFIGGVHRMAAAVDQQVAFVAGCFSRDFENTRLTGEQLYLDPSRCYRTYQEMAESEAKRPLCEYLLRCRGGDSKTHRGKSHENRGG